MGQLREELKVVLEKMEPPNIIVIGRTGAGKSTLINTVFGSELAQTGTGLPVSDAFVRFPRYVEEKPLVFVYDSAGYEMSHEFRFKNAVTKFLREKRELALEENIHLAWYVVHAGMKRFEHFDAEIISILRSERIPVILVLSQADLARPNELFDIEKTIKEYRKIHSMDEVETLQVSAHPISGEPFGVSELVEYSSKLLPELYTEAFIAKQITDLNLKKKLAGGYVKAAATGCFASGYVPVVNTTPAAIVATQTLLCMKIAALYGHADWVRVLDKAGGITLASMFTIGLTWALDLFSFILPPTIPFSGTIAGAAGATYITMVGRTYSAVFEKLCCRDLTGKDKGDVEAFIRQTFKEEFRKNTSFTIRSKNDLYKIDQYFD